MEWKSHSFAVDYFYSLPAVTDCLSPEAAPALWTCVCFTPINGILVSLFGFFDLTGFVAFYSYK